jgi:pyruvate dehydrogenase E2 component (dihydrolipoamide acetyltransferase)
MAEFLMPSLGADMEAGRVVQWLVQPGDTVHHGDVVAVVDTDKADIEIEVFSDGVVEQLLVPEGERVAVGTPLATLRPLDATVAPPPETAPSPSPVAPLPETGPSPPPMAETVTPAPAPALPTLVAGDAGEQHVHSPIVRRLAHHLAIDLATLTGTGPGGEITRHDVEQAAERASATPITQPKEPRNRDAEMRHRIAALMARSKREIPHYYLSTHVDLRAGLVWLESTNSAREVNRRLIPAALFLKAVALASREVPEMNGFWIDDDLRASASVHVGVAVSLRGGGLIAPALHDVETMTLDDVMTALRDLVARTRSGRLRASEMSDPTITVTNLGDQGSEAVYGVIYPPQVALVGFGKIVERPWAVDGMVGVHPIVTVTLAADHRATDGHLGARFLSAIDRLLQRPEDL